MLDYFLNDEEAKGIAAILTKACLQTIAVLS